MSGPSARTGRLGDWLACLLPAALGLLVGLLAHDRTLVDLEAVAAMGKAWQAFHLQAHANLALIGFEQPPLLVLLYVPLAAFAPGLLVSGLAAPLLGAAFLGLSGLVLWRFGRVLGLSGWLTALAVAALALHPLVLSGAALGARSIVLLFALLGLSCSVAHWGRTERVRDLVTGGIFAAAAILLCYEMIVVVLGAALYLGGRCRGSSRPARAEGTLIAFLMPAAYVALVWFVADWAIMGQPGHFWRTAMTVGAHPPLAGMVPWPPVVLQVVLVSQPLLLALLYAHLRPVGQRLTGAPVLGMLLLGLLAPTVFGTLRPVHGEDVWVTLLPLAALAVAAGWTLTVSLLADLSRSGADWRRLVSPGLIVIAAGSLFLAWTQQGTPRGLPVGVRSVLAGQAAFATAVGAEWRVAARLPQDLSPARHHVLAGMRAFVVAGRAQSGLKTHVQGSVSVPGSAWVRQLEAGSWLVLEDPDSQAGPHWQRILPPYLKVTPRWREGDWQGYELTLQPLEGR